MSELKAERALREAEAEDLGSPLRFFFFWGGLGFRETSTLEFSGFRVFFRGLGV